MKLGLAIPFFNEDECCERVVRDLVEVLRRERVPYQLALVNNGSTDQTPALLNGLASELDNCAVVHLQDNAGYGGGILSGMRSLKTPYLGWHWGDGQVDSKVVIAAYRAATENPDGLAKAIRRERHDGKQRMVISAVFNRAMGLLGAASRDVNGCPKVFSRETWGAIAPQSTDWFLDAEVVLAAEELGLTWTEVDAVMETRQSGISKVKVETVFEFLGNLGRRVF